MPNRQTVLYVLNKINTSWEGKEQDPETFKFKSLVNDTVAFKKGGRKVGKDKGNSYWVQTSFQVNLRGICYFKKIFIDVNECLAYGFHLLQLSCTNIYGI